MVGRHVHLASKPREGDDRSLEMELLMPVEVYWNVRDELKKADYLVASGEDPTVLADAYRRIYKLVLPYTVHEKDRLWILEKTNVGK